MVDGHEMVTPNECEHCGAPTTGRYCDHNCRTAAGIQDTDDTTDRWTVSSIDEALEFENGKYAIASWDLHWHADANGSLPSHAHAALVQCVRDAARVPELEAENARLREAVDEFRRFWAALDIDEAEAIASSTKGPTMSNEIRCPKCGSTDVECVEKPHHNHICHGCGHTLLGDDYPVRVDPYCQETTFRDRRRTSWEA